MSRLGGKHLHSADFRIDSDPEFCALGRNDEMV